MTGVLSNGAVDRRCVLMQGKYIYTFKISIFPDSAPKWGKNIIQRHDKNI